MPALTPNAFNALSLSLVDRRKGGNAPSVRHDDLTNLEAVAAARSVPPPCRSNRQHRHCSSDDDCLHLASTTWDHAAYPRRHAPPRREQ